MSINQSAPSVLSARHVFVEGRVQGVYFRQSLQAYATSLGVAGWCRNLPDGKVEARFQGDASSVQQVVDWCHQGPAMARVDRVIARDAAPSPAFIGFEITG